MVNIISDKTVKVLRASLLPGIGAVGLRKFVKAAHLKQDAIDLPDEKISSLFGRSGEQINASLISDRVNALIDEALQDGQIIISAFDEEYPRALLHIDDFPPLLFVKGNVLALNVKSIAVVGTREVSRLGKSWARQISSILAEESFSVVSGLALGVDAAAHEGALSKNGTTVAVLAHGLDKVTPARNRDLASRILEAGGALVAEHPPKTPPRRPEYVRRNRIQSGMSLASVIVESGSEGGAIHQANFTHKQGRKLYCVLPPTEVDGSSEFNYGGARKIMEDLSATSIADRRQLMSEVQHLSNNEKFHLLRAVPEKLIASTRGTLL